MEYINLFESDYIKEYAELCYFEWSNKKKKLDVIEKIRRIKTKNNVLLAIGLLNDEELVGFISLFKNDHDELKELTPWYATMYVKEKYRGNGYSKLLNNELLKQTKELGYKRIYLKTELINYYEKYGAILFKEIDNEKIYYIDL